MKATLRGTEIYFDIAGMQLAPVKKDFAHDVYIKTIQKFLRGRL